ncbi:MAG: hypothetical protein DRN07_02945 [Thermoplasmata archaeon]|nr:MAG: hypothetical protein DRN07_02945 [Thermoplasmata archaeon]
MQGMKEERAGRDIHAHLQGHAICPASCDFEPAYADLQSATLPLGDPPLPKKELCFLTFFNAIP